MKRATTRGPKGPVSLTLTIDPIAAELLTAVARYMGQTLDQFVQHEFAESFGATLDDIAENFISRKRDWLTVAAKKQGVRTHGKA
jgi:hypothetical protein